MSEINPSNGVKIIFEDNHVLVAYKPAGVLSQGDGTNAPDMLTILKAYLKEKYNKPGEVFLGLLHRLDRPVSGIMVFAKTSKCASRISEQIRQRKVTKKYRAIVVGEFKNGEGRFEDYLLKDSKTNITRVVKTPTNDSKKCSLTYKVLGKTQSEYGTISLVEIDLETGRSHQIRCQFSSRGHSLLGDAKYGDLKYKGDILLESYLIGFSHPITKEYKEYSLPLKNEKPWNLFDNC